MSQRHGLNTPTYFENRRTSINSMHEINDETRKGCYCPVSEPNTTRFPPSPRRYAPEEFGLDENEQFQHPRVFEDLTFQTDAAALNQMQAAQTRPRYQNRGFNISDLPSEQLENLSGPHFADSNVCEETDMGLSDQYTPNIADISAPDFCDISDASPWPQRTPPRHSPGQSFPDECLDDISAPNYESPVCSPSPQVHYSPIQLQPTPEVCFPSPTQSPEPSPPSFHYSPIRFQPSPVRYPSECLDDVSAPSLGRSPMSIPSLPSPPNISMPQDLPSEMVCDVSPPSYRTPPTPQASYPSERLDEMTIPSFENASCGSPLDRRFLLDSRIMDESPPSMVSSFGQTPSTRRSSRRATSPPRQSSPANVCPSQMPYQQTPLRKLSSPPRRFNMAEFMAQCMAEAPPAPQYSLISPSPRRTRVRTPSPVCTPSPSPAPHFSLRSPTPVGSPPMRSLPSDLPSECLTNVSEPAYFNSPPRGSPAGRSFPSDLPSEYLADMSQPSYQMTPPPCTPQTPQDLPSEMICDVSAPQYQSPASERLSGVSMPSFQDASHGSPLDRRFLFDQRIEDESAPTFSSLASSSRRSSPGPCAPVPCPPQRARSSSPRQSPPGQFNMANFMQQCMAEAQPAPHFSLISPSPRRPKARTPSPVCSPSPPPAPHFSLRSPTPVGSPPMRSLPSNLPSECLTNVSEPAYFDSPPRGSPARSFPSDLPSECLADMSQPSYQMTPPPCTPQTPQDLPSEMICDVSAPQYQSPPSEHISSVSMPSFEDVSYSSPLDRRFLLDPRLEDESMPSMGASRSLSPIRSSSPCPTDESSFDTTYNEILQRFNALKSKAASPRASGDGRLSTPRGKCIKETVVERTENENGKFKSTTQHIVVTVDPCGSIHTHTNEHKTQCPPNAGGARLMAPSVDSGVASQSPRPAAQIDNLRQQVRRRLDYSLPDLPGDNLADETPPAMDDLPSMSAENIIDRLPSVPEEQLANVSAPCYQSPPTPSISYPSQMLDDMTIPSFENASCGSPLDRRFLLDPRIVDETPPSLVSSFASSPGRSMSQRSTGYTPGPPMRMPSPAARAPTPPPQRFNMQQFMRERMAEAPPAPHYSLISPSPRRPRPKSPSPQRSPSASPPPHFSLRSPTPIYSPPMQSLPTNLPSERITDVSEPAYFTSPPRASPATRFPSNLPSDRLTDISEPSYQRTPPPRTPQTPTDLPSEMLGDISAPSYQSPASEHLESMTMPSMEDVSYSSPLDRRFLLDSSLADETMPSLPRTPSTMQSEATPIPMRGGARRRLSYGSEPSSRRGSSPATVAETHTVIQQMGTFEQQHSVSSGGGKSSPARGSPNRVSTEKGGRRVSSPLLDQSKEALHIATSIHSITRLYPEQSEAGPSGKNLGRRSLSLPGENLFDVTAPSAPPSFRTTSGSRGARSSTQNLDDISPISFASTFPSTGISGAQNASPPRRARRSIQDVDDISPISFASSFPSTDASGTSSNRRKQTPQYLSTSSRGLSGLANYAPFIEQIRSSTRSSGADDICDLYTPAAPVSVPCNPCANVRSSNRKYQQPQRTRNYSC